MRQYSSISLKIGITVLLAKVLVFTAFLSKYYIGAIIYTLAGKESFGTIEMLNIQNIAISSAYYLINGLSIVALFGAVIAIYGFIKKQLSYKLYIGAILNIINVFIIFNSNAT